MTFELHHGSALHPDMIEDNSVDLIVGSTPYWGLREYEDDGTPIAGQIGGEATPQEFLETQWAVAKALWPKLRDTGSMFWNMGDKRAGSGSNNNSGIASTNRQSPAVYNQAKFGRDKTKMLLPHRFAAGCIDGRADPDGIGWLVRQDQVWAKRNGTPETVADRTADRHEYWFHLTKQGDYYSATDELREPHAEGTLERYEAGYGDRSHYDDERPSTGIELGGNWEANPLGKIPGSVTAGVGDNYEWALWCWLEANRPDVLAAFTADLVAGQDLPSVWTTVNEPLKVPAFLPQHFAAFPTEWPRRIILGWSPPGYCLECGEPRRPVIDRQRTRDGSPVTGTWQATEGGHQVAGQGVGHWRYETRRTLLGYACSCCPTRVVPERRHRRPRDNNGDRVVRNRAAQPCATDSCTDDDHWTTIEVAVPDLAAWPNPPATRPAVVLDPFLGTGTTLVCTEALGRHGIGIDISADYLRLARWRIEHSGHVAKVAARTYGERQGSMFG